jgi:hypothetical protein
MVSPLFFSLLVLCALLWLFVILHLTRPKRAVTAPASPALPEPLKPKRNRSSERKPFEGVTQKPLCALCERDTLLPQAPPPVPPAPMPSTPRRPVRAAPLCTSVRTALVTMVVGWGLGIFGSTAIPVAAPGVSATVSLVKGKLYNQSCAHKLKSLRVAHVCRAAAGLPPPSWLDDRRAMVSWERMAQREQETRTLGFVAWSLAVCAGYRAKPVMDACIYTVGGMK